MLEKVIYVFRKKIGGGGGEITIQAKIAFDEFPLVAMVSFTSPVNNNYE